MTTSLAASDNLNFNSVPPIRLIPSKNSLIFRKSGYKVAGETAELNCWSNLASNVCSKFILDNYPKKNTKEKNEANQAAAAFGGIPYHTEHSALDEVNRILSHPLFLNTDYEISGECLFLTPINVFNENTDRTNDEMHELLHKLDAEIHLQLRQKSNGQLIEIEDVGVAGISQIIPVLSAIVSGSRKVYIQQPELHLHPKLQAQLADAFVEHVSKNIKTLVILVLLSNRIVNTFCCVFYAIRETHKGDIKNKLFSLSPEHVSVLYVDKLEDGSSKFFP